MHPKTLTLLSQSFCLSLVRTPIRSAVYHPMYLSPTYEQLEYSPYYFNKAFKFKVQRVNGHQVSEERLPDFLIGQIQEDKRNFIKNKEFVFIGRSNTGKSAIINGIFGQKVARVSRVRGTTREMHFHQGRIGATKVLLVDAPGYGYADINKRKRQMWAGLVDQYLKISSRLAQIFLCINFEHGLKNSDIETLKHITKYNINIQLILCKADKVSQKNFLPQLKSINEQVRRLQLENINDRILACSTKTKFGMDVLKCRVIECIEKSKQRNIDENQQLLLEYVKNIRVQAKDRALPENEITRPHVVRKLIYNSKLTKFLL